MKRIFCWSMHLPVPIYMRENRYLMRGLFCLLRYCVLVWEFICVHDFVKLLLCYCLSIRGLVVVAPYVVYMLYYGAWIEYICLLSFVYIQVNNIVFVVCGWLYKHVTIQKWQNAFSNEIRRSQRIWLKSKKLYKLNSTTSTFYGQG